MTASLIVTVDTEEEGLWDGCYRRTGNTVENIRGIPRFQNLCDQYGVRPTYLVDAAVLEEPWAVEILRGIQDDGRCEIGAHCHPWCNPPFEEEISTRNSYLCNLPEALQRAKLTWLTERIEECFGRRPTSFRAGRYGLDITGARILADLGYTVDSSVIPFTDYSSEQGPNFLNAPVCPYWIDLAGNSLLEPHNSGGLLEVPVTVGFNRANFQRAHSVQQFARRHLRPLRVEGLLDRLGILRRIKLTPEQATAAEMITLVEMLLRRKSPCLVLMLHSSSLMAGGSPYVTDQDELERIVKRLESTFRHCTVELGLSAATLTNLADVGHVPSRHASPEACLKPA